MGASADTVCIILSLSLTGIMYGPIVGAAVPVLDESMLSDIRVHVGVDADF